MRLLFGLVLILSSVVLKAQPCSVQIDSTADCGLNCSGTAMAYPQGQGPFSYLWQPGGQTTQQISNLCPGSYTVTVTDSLGCVVTDSLTVNGSPVLNVWISSFTNPSCVGCNDGSATGSVNGGTPAYYPYWIPPIGFGLYTINNLQAGTYQFCVEDIYGCVSCADTTLQDPLSVPDYSVSQRASSYDLFDVTGKLIYTGSGNPRGSVNCLTGLYILTYKNRDGEVIFREVILFEN